MTITKSARLALVAILLSPLAANADLITNGDFDTDLDGWTQSGDIGTTWDNGTAHVGRPGTPGESVFQQAFQIPTGTGAVSISFTYEWQNIAPYTADLFEVMFQYGGGGLQTLLTESSDSASFLSTVSFSTIVNLPGLSPLSPNAWLTFKLTENNYERGTRIELDNVVVKAVSVPEPGTLALFGLGLVGMGFARRRTASS